MRFETSGPALKRSVTVEFFRSGGPGGQHRNKTETAVRLRHEPSGLSVISADSRSQAKNLETAFCRLKKRLEALNRTAKRRVPTSVPQGSRERRLKSKRARAQKKDLRRPPSDY